MATAFWKQPSLYADESSFVRMNVRDDVTHLCSANAALSGFERACPKLSGAMIDAALSSLQSGSTDRHQLVRASKSAASVLDSWPIDHAEDTPTGWILIASVVHGRLTALWAGDDGIAVVRNSEVVFSTSSHKHPRGFLERGLGKSYQETAPEVVQDPLPLQPRDQVFFLSGAVRGHPACADVIRNASSQETQATVDRLVREVAQEGKTAYAFAVAISI